MISILITLTALIDLYQPQTQLGIMTYGGMTLLQIIGIYILMCCFLKKVSFANSILIQSLSCAVINIFEYILVFLTNYFKEDRTFFLAAFLVVGITAGSIILSIIIIYLFRNTKFFLSIKSLLAYERFSFVFGLIFFLCDLFLYLWIFLGKRDTDGINLILSIIYLVLLIIFSLWAFGIDKNRQWEYSQSMLIQQRSYLMHLEEIQQELRSVQHDYKNLLAAIYLHADQGNTPEIKDFLVNKLFKIDGKIVEKIKKKSQLLNMEIVEIKSLLMSKLAMAEQNGVKIHLEIVVSISNIPMNLHDFLRVLGILLDNAIEAVLTQKSKVINVLLIQEEKQLVILIKNPYSQKISINNLSKPGFTTKGKGRGLGLANVNKILSDYSNVLHETRIKDSQFIQILTLKKIM